MIAYTRTSERPGGPENAVLTSGSSCRRGSEPTLDQVVRVGCEWGTSPAPVGLALESRIHNPVVTKSRSGGPPAVGQLARSVPQPLAFLSRIIPFQNSDMEKLYTYSRFLRSKLPRRQGGPQYHFEDEMTLKFSAPEDQRRHDHARAGRAR